MAQMALPQKDGKDKWRRAHGTTFKQTPIVGSRSWFDKAHGGMQTHAQHDEKGPHGWIQVAQRPKRKREWSVQYTKSGCSCWRFLNISSYFILSPEKKKEKKKQRVYCSERGLEPVWSVCVTVTHKYQRSVRHNALLRVLYKDERGLVEICVLFNTAAQYDIWHLLVSVHDGPLTLDRITGRFAYRGILPYGILQVTFPLKLVKYLTCITGDSTGHVVESQYFMMCI